jgi:5-methylcytosine-specific restriction protein A
MPNRAMSICCEPGCSAIVPKGRCARHARPAWGGANRPSPADRGYDAEYKRNRPIVLERDPVCTIQSHCMGAPSVEVDHIQPVSRGGGNDLGNLRGACHRCNHARHSARGGQGRKGYTLRPHSMA